MKHSKLQLFLCFSLISLLCTCQTTQITAKKKQSEEVNQKPIPKSKPITHKKINMLSEDTSHFPYITLRFQLFGENNEAITHLVKDDIDLEYEQTHFGNPKWGDQPALSLTEYFSKTPTNQTEIVSLERPVPSELNVYQLKWFDTNWNTSTDRRTYSINIHVDTYHFSHEITYKPNTALIRQWKQQELESALGYIKDHENTDGIMNTLLNRYPLNDLTEFFKQVHEYVVNDLAKNNIEAAIPIVEQYERFFSENECWSQSLQKDYEVLADRFVQSTQYKKAIPLYQKSISIQPNQPVYQKLLDCQLKVFDYAEAQSSIDWLDSHGKITDKNYFLRKKALTFAGQLNFERTEKIVSELVKDHSADDSLWRFMFLSWKGYWYGACAKMLANVNFDLDSKNEYMQIVKFIRAEEDLRWIALSDSDKKVIFSTDESIINKNLSSIQLSFEYIDTNLEKTFFCYESKENENVGYIVSPANLLNVTGNLIICYDDHPTDPEERDLMYQIKNAYENEEIRDSLKDILANRCGGAMIKTLGEILKHEDLSYRNWTSVAINYRTYLPKELLNYIILAGKESPNGPIHVMKRVGDSIPEEIVENNRANQNPFFLYKKWEGFDKAFFELTTAIYADEVWIGVVRTGYSW